MDNNLFNKYKKVIQKKENTKEKIILFLEKETGIIFLKEEIIIKGNNISFNTSSVKKHILQRSKIDLFLKENKLKRI